MGYNARHRIDTIISGSLISSESSPPNQFTGLFSMELSRLNPEGDSGNHGARKNAKFLYG
jgi:hypothetical protein